ncbi:MAG: transglutaminase domain-containing protein [Calditrichae bacterium]|nr:transglutaminase domain-containing protein [Calditrichia bacterium]
MKKIIILLGLFMYTTTVAQTNFSEINKLIDKGEFSEAQKLINIKIGEGDIDEDEIYNLRFKEDVLNRIRMDFSRDEEYVKNALKKYFPDLSEEQIKEWEESNQLEMKIIDGKKMYFRNAVPNLFRKNPTANKIKQLKDGSDKSSLEKFLESYLPDVVKAAQDSSKIFVSPKNLKITYSLSVKPDKVKDGEVVRAWLPFPRTDNKRISNLKLISVSNPEYIIAPDKYVHKSIYLEEKAQQGKPVVFSYSAEYTAFNEVNKIDLNIRPDYSADNLLFKEYTSERETHIIFTDAIKMLSKKIVGDEKNLLKKAKLIYLWIGKNIPWTSALEYSTIQNIPMYCVENGRGDCGIKAMLFITLCRYNGIPAKWQSGWFIYPDNMNLHDWAEIYIPVKGWIPVDPDFNNQQIAEKTASEFFFGSTDAYRLIINEDFSGAFYPAKTYPRSETVDFQRGEVEWKGGNLYFNDWNYDMEVEYID